MRGTLDTKVAIVTGAGRGIGKEIALAYAREGAAVCCAARTASEIQATSREIEMVGGHAIAIPTDVSQPDAVYGMVEATISSFQGLDILVVNAGVNLDRLSVEESDPEAWLATIQVNLVGAYHCAKASIPHLKARGSGKIIFIGSGLGHRPFKTNSAYACSKAGLWMLTRILAEELWPHNICVNELVPGPVDTQTGLRARPDSVFGIQSEWVKQPEEVVPLALFLATQPEKGPTAQSFSLMSRVP